MILQVFLTWNKLGSATGGRKEKTRNFFSEIKKFTDVRNVLKISVFADFNDLCGGYWEAKVEEMSTLNQP